MNRRNHFVYLPILLLLLTFASPYDASAQLHLLSDSLRQDTLESIPYIPLPIGSCGMFLTPYDQPFLLVQDSAWFAELIESKRFIGQCKELIPPDVDYTRNAVVGFDLFVDCNARAGVRVVRDTAARKYIILVDTYYGGCRGMTSLGYWLLIPALKEGETIEIHERDHDDRYRWDE